MVFNALGVCDSLLSCCCLRRDVIYCVLGLDAEERGVRCRGEGGARVSAFWERDGLPCVVLSCPSFFRLGGGREFLEFDLLMRWTSSFDFILLLHPRLPDAVSHPAN